jgi:hypothetical protein
MKKVSGLLFVFFTMSLVLTSVKLISPVSANTRLPGVHSGQFLNYSINMTASGNDTELMVHVQQLQGWGNVTVFSVSGVNVAFQQVFYNATANQSCAILQNVENGQFNSSMSLFSTFFIAANLSAGDPIFIGSGGVPSINETVTANYLSQQLETNHLMISSNQTNTYQYGYLTNLTMTGQVYWERKTGIMLDYHFEVDLNRPDGTGGVLITHIQMRVLILSAVPPPPVVPEFPSLLILPLLMSATILAVIFYRSKRKTD